MLTAVKRHVSAPAGKGVTTLLDVVPSGRTPERRFMFSGPSRWSLGLRVVAALFVLVTAGVVGGRLVLLQQRAPELSVAGSRTFTSAPGQRLAFHLVDGTAVTLAPGSVLQVPADYGVRTRAVDLEGEAAFLVSHDAARPFTVRTAYGLARDLGTRFVVRAYPGDTVTEVAVAEGLVAVLPAGTRGVSEDSVVLERGDLARFSEEGTMTVRRGVALEPHFAWLEGRLAFRDVPLREVTVRLSRWYGIDIGVNDSTAGDRLLTAAFDEISAADVLPLIAASLNLELTYSGRSYTFHTR